MPRRPLKPCNYAGCSELVQGGEKYCAKHKIEKQTQMDNKRFSASERGYDSRWKKARIRYLRKHPLCVECLKINLIVVATVVDHISPHKGDKKLFWDEANWQALCKRHHNIKTASEDGGFGNAIPKPPQK